MMCMRSCPPSYVPRTLVLNLEETLVHTSEALLTGVTVQLRPGAREFLKHLAQLYEVVVFSTGRRDTLDEICHALDPDAAIIAHRLNMAHLTRDPATGRFEKDIRILNRSPARVVVVDAASAPGSEWNTVLVPRWKGDADDRALLCIMQFLEHLVVDGVPDIRQEVLDNGGGVVAPAAWLGKKVQNAKKPPGMRGLLK
jgi:import inner membrane translocase subunit TIM50